jgi:hypothetical protein
MLRKLAEALGRANVLQCIKFEPHHMPPVLFAQGDGTDEGVRPLHEAHQCESDFGGSIFIGPDEWFNKEGLATA